MQLPQIAALLTRAEDTPETGRTPARGTEGAAFQSVFSGSEPEAEPALPDLPTDLAPVATAPASALGHPAAASVAVPRDAGDASLDVATTPQAKPTHPTVSALPSAGAAHEVTAGEGEPAAPDLRATMPRGAAEMGSGDSSPVPTPRVARGSGDGPMPGRSVPDSEAKASDQGRAQKMPAQETGPGFASRSEAGGDAPTVPGRSGEMYATAKIKPAPSPGMTADGQLADSPTGPAKTERPGGATETGARTLSGPVDTKPVGVDAVAPTARQLTGEPSGTDPSVRADVPADIPKRPGSRTLPTVSNHVSAPPEGARLAGGLSSAAHGAPRAVERDATTPVTTRSGQPQNATGVSVLNAHAAPQEASAMTQGHRADTRPSDVPMPSRVTDGPPAGASEAPRAATASPSSIPGGDTAAAPASSIATTLSGAGEMSFAADPAALDAGPGEPRVAARTSVPAALPIHQSPETPRNVALQIVEIMRASGERAVELRLQPEELGRLQLTMSQDATGTLSVALNVERSETLDLLRRNIDLLAAELRALGYESVDFSFHGDGATGDEASDTERSAAQRKADADGRVPPDAGPPQTGASRPGKSGDGIDIRL